MANGSRLPSGTEVFSTLGLSDHPLGAHRVRIELLMIAPAGLTPGTIPPILHHAGALPLAADAVPQLGDIYSAVSGLGEISPMEDLLVLRPLYQKPDFSPFDNGVERVHFLWLIPIHDIESEFVEVRGWPAFEQVMWDLDVDPTDFSREAWLE